MTNFTKLAQSRALTKGNTQKMKIGRRDYQGLTLDQVRRDVLDRAIETRNIIAAWSGGKLEAPMAWTGRNCIVLKVGYGQTNIGLAAVNADFPSDDPRRFQYYANGATPQERRDDALEEIDFYIAEISAGGMDAEMEALISAYQVRAGRRVASKKQSFKIAA